MAASITQEDVRRIVAHTSVRRAIHHRVRRSTSPFPRPPPSSRSAAVCDDPRLRRCLPRGSTRISSMWRTPPLTFPRGRARGGHGSVPSGNPSILWTVMDRLWKDQWSHQSASRSAFASSSWSNEEVAQGDFTAHSLVEVPCARTSAVSWLGESCSGRAGRRRTVSFRARRSGAYPAAPPARMVRAFADPTLYLRSRQGTSDRAAGRAAVVALWVLTRFRPARRGPLPASASMCSGCCESVD